MNEKETIISKAGQQLTIKAEENKKLNENKTRLTLVLQRITNENSQLEKDLQCILNRELDESQNPNQILAKQLDNLNSQIEEIYKKLSIAKKSSHVINEEIGGELQKISILDDTKEQNLIVIDKISKKIKKIQNKTPQKKVNRDLEKEINRKNQEYICNLQQTKIMFDEKEKAISQLSEMKNKLQNDLDDAKQYIQELEGRNGRRDNTLSELYNKRVRNEDSMQHFKTKYDVLTEQNSHIENEIKQVKLATEKLEQTLRSSNQKISNQDIITQELKKIAEGKKAEADQNAAAKKNIDIYHDQRVIDTQRDLNTENDKIMGKSASIEELKKKLSLIQIQIQKRTVELENEKKKHIETKSKLENKLKEIKNDLIEIIS